MRILIGSPYFAPRTGGLETYVQHLAHGLIDAGHEVVVVCGDDVPEVRRELQDGLDRLPPSDLANPVAHPDRCALAVLAAPDHRGGAARRAHRARPGGVHGRRPGAGGRPAAVRDHLARGHPGETGRAAARRGHPGLRGGAAPHLPAGRPHRRGVAVRPGPPGPVVGEDPGGVQRGARGGRAAAGRRRRLRVRGQPSGRARLEGPRPGAGRPGGAPARARARARRSP